MNIHPKNLSRPLSALALAASVAVCHAGSIQLTPVRVQLSDAARVAVVTVHNSGAEESVMQVTLNKWALQGSHYTYAPTPDLIVTPATFRLAAGAQQIVRIGLAGPVPASEEAAYRLWVEEVPPPTQPSVTGTRLVVRHDVPVFVTPAVPPKAALDVSLDCAPGGAYLRLSNIGNVHTQLRSVVLQSTPAKQTLASWETADYLLPQAQTSWQLTQNLALAPNQRVLVTTLTDQGSFTADVANLCP